MHHDDDDDGAKAVSFRWVILLRMLVVTRHDHWWHWNSHSVS